jgi:hypothetical protein
MMGEGSQSRPLVSVTLSLRAARGEGWGEGCFQIFAVVARTFVIAVRMKTDFRSFTRRVKRFPAAVGILIREHPCPSVVDKADYSFKRDGASIGEAPLPVNL